MSPRLRTLLALVAGLLLTRGGVALVDRPPAPPAPLLDVDPAAVTRVVLGRGAASLALVREASAPGGWVVVDEGGRRATARPGVDALLERLRAWRRDRPAGRDPTRHAEWGVSEERARTLRLEAASGEPLADLLVGRIAGIELADAVSQGGALDTRRLGLFVRERGEDATWVVNEFLTRELEPTPAAWLAPPLQGVAPEDVARLEVRAGDLALALVFAPGAAPRLDGDPRPVEPGRARGLLLAALGLTPTGLPSVSQPPVTAAATVQVTTHDGTTRSTSVLTVEAPGPPRALATGPDGALLELDPRGLERLLARLREASRE